MEDSVSIVQLTVKPVPPFPNVLSAIGPTTWSTATALRIVPWVPSTTQEIATIVQPTAHHAKIQLTAPVAHQASTCLTVPPSTSPPVYHHAPPPISPIARAGASSVLVPVFSVTMPPPVLNAPAASPSATAYA